jgi:protein TonB
MWQREPTHAELVTYLPPGIRPSGWGVIACRTIEDFRVDDCYELGQSPPGSGLSRAVRRAAWQFRVRPPRIGGKPVIGAWVRIRIEFNEGITR